MFNRVKKKSAYEAKNYKILRTRDAFGRKELVLFGPDNEKKKIPPPPKPGRNLHGVGIRSPLKHETNYVGVRHMEGDEITKIEKGPPGKPPIQQEPDDVKSNFRASDAVSPERLLVPESKREKHAKCREAVDSPRTIPLYPNSCYEEDLRRAEVDNRITILDQARQSKKCMSRAEWQHSKDTYIHGLPVYAVHVQWKAGPYTKVYTLEMVQSLLSRHGKIVSLTQISPNSAVVEFKNVETARRAMFCYCLALKNCPLICSWWFPEMWNYNTMVYEQRTREEKKAFIVFDEATLMKMAFKKLQAKGIIHFKKYMPQFGYNLGTFNP